MAPCRFIDKGHLLDRSGFEVIAAFRQKGQAILDNVYERVEDEFGLLDPDAPGNWTLEEFQDLYCCLKQKLGDRFAEVDPALKDFYRDILLDPMRPGELITVPTGSLFIEALPGEHPVLEDFKALHRAVDVKKAQAEVRRIELENARYAARLLNDEREDPDVEREIVVEGGGVIVNPDPS
jgi:hypothetical protein